MVAWEKPVEVVVVSDFSPLVCSSGLTGYDELAGGLMLRAGRGCFTVMCGLVCALGAVAIGGWLFLVRPFVFKSERLELEVRADPLRLKEYTKRLSTEFFPRDSQNIDNLNSAAEWISSEFKRSSAKVWFQEFEVKGEIYKNVVAEFGQSDAENRGVVVIGAHYDVADELPGADDNASGVAGLLELARLISLKPLPFKVILVAYTLEEPPFFGTSYMGSAIHAGSLLESGEKVKLMIALEMIGYFSDEAQSQSYPLPFLNWFYPDIGNFIAVIGPMTLSSATVDLKAALLNSTELPAHSINAPSWVPGVDFSDHRNYWQAGFDAVMITDTAFFRNQAYHTADDTYDRLDYERMAEVVTGVSAYLLRARGQE